MSPKQRAKKKSVKVMEILEDKEILQFIKSFHTRLAKENEQRDVSSTRTDLEKQTDAMGRLLTGDETCAAVAIDGERIFIATNTNRHHRERIDLQLTRLFIKAGSTQEDMRLVSEFEFTTSKKKIIRQSAPVHYMRQSDQPSPAAPSETLFVNLGILQTEHKLVEFTFPYLDENGHGIAEYPYPITIRYSLYQHMPGIIFSGRLTGDFEVSGIQKPSYHFTLDPLYRRAEVLFQHLGLIAIYLLKDCPTTTTDFNYVLNLHRTMVIMQTLAWEAPTWFKLNEALRDYSDTAAATALEQKRTQLRQLNQLIEQMTADLLSFQKLHAEISTRKRHRSAPSAASADSRFFSINDSPQSTVEKWARRKMELNDLKLPEFIKLEKKKFFERISLYFRDLLELENFVAQEAMNKRPIAEVLASIGARDLVNDEAFSRTNPFFKPEAEIMIVDDLVDGTHAELRLFWHLKIVERQLFGNPIPYFGITQLCCANCHLFLKSHGVDYVEGSRHRAGKHAKHYPGWVLDSEFRTEGYLRVFLGESYSYYEKLTGDLTYGEHTKSRKEWALFAIEELGTLNLEALEKFELPPKIWDEKGSNFADTIAL